MIRTLLFIFLSQFGTHALASVTLSEADQRYAHAKSLLRSSNPQEISQGLLELKSAAEIGVTDARLLYFHLTSGERPIEQRPRIAYYWIRESAEAGVAQAQYLQGREYLMGKSVHRDEMIAAHWLKLAARQGHQEATHELNELLAKWSPQQVKEFESR